MCNKYNVSIRIFSTQMSLTIDTYIYLNRRQSTLNNELLKLLCQDLNGPIIGSFVKLLL